MRRVLLAVLAGSLGPGCVAGGSAAPPDAHPPATDGGGDTGGAGSETGGGDTGEGCPPPTLLAPTGIDLWAGSRYDLVLAGADGAALDGTELACEPLAGRLVCPWTPEAAGQVALTAWASGCEPADLGALAAVAPEGVLPGGDRFPMLVYEAESTAFAELAAAGVNGVQTYATGEALAEWQAEAEAAGLPYSFHVDATEEIAAGLAAAGLGWWDLPEESRYWYEDELALIQALAAAIRAVDDRPVYMYLPGHYLASDIAWYVDTLDIIGAGAYAEYQGQPHAWIRWRVESEIEAIEQAGYTTDDRLPLGVIGVFDSTPYGGDGSDATEVVHDHLAAVAAGARGLYTFAWWHAVHDANMADSADAILEVAERVEGAEALGEWVARGVDEGDLDVTVTGGPDEVAVTPLYAEEALRYPSVRARAWSHAGAWAVVVVNSAEEPVEAVVSGLPGERAERVHDGLVEEAPGGELAVSLDRLEARVYRVVDTRG